MTESESYCSHKNMKIPCHAFDNELDGNQFNFFSREKEIDFLFFLKGGSERIWGEDVFVGLSVSLCEGS